MYPCLLDKHAGRLAAAQLPHDSETGRSGEEFRCSTARHHASSGCGQAGSHVLHYMGTSESQQLEEKQKRHRGMQSKGAAAVVCDGWLMWLTISCCYINMMMPLACTRRWREEGYGGWPWAHACLAPAGLFAPSQPTQPGTSAPVLFATYSRPWTELKSSVVSTCSTASHRRSQL